MTVRLYIDPNVCTGHGRCYSIAPELLSLDDQGYVEQRGREIDVPTDLIELADEAEGTCPEAAIRLIREEQ
jgi:ferredoxin